MSATPTRAKVDLASSCVLTAVRCALLVLATAACGSRSTPRPSAAAPPPVAPAAIEPVAGWHPLAPATAAAPPALPGGAYLVAGHRDGRVAVLANTARGLRLIARSAGQRIELPVALQHGAEGLALAFTDDALVLGNATRDHLELFRLERGALVAIAIPQPPAPTSPAGLTSLPALAFTPRGFPLIATRAIAADRDVVVVRQWTGTQWSTATTTAPASYDIAGGLRHETCATEGFDPAPPFCSPIDPPAIAVDASDQPVVAWVSGGNVLRLAFRVGGGFAVRHSLTFDGPAASPWGASAVIVSLAPAAGWIAAYRNRAVDARGPWPNALAAEGAEVVAGAAATRGALVEISGSLLLLDPAHRTAQTAGLATATAAFAAAGDDVVSIDGAQHLVVLDGVQWIPFEPAAQPLSALADGWVDHLALVATAPDPAIAWLGGPSVRSPTIRRPSTAGWQRTGATFAGPADVRRTTIPVLGTAVDPTGALAVVTGDADTHGNGLSVARWTHAGWEPTGPRLAVGGNSYPAVATLAYDPTGAPIVAWSEDAGVRVARLAGDRWEITPGPGDPPCHALALDASDARLRLVTGCRRAVTAWRDDGHTWRADTTPLEGTAAAVAISRTQTAAIIVGDGHTIALASWRDSAWTRVALPDAIGPSALALGPRAIGVAWLGTGGTLFATSDGTTLSAPTRFAGAERDHAFATALVMTPRPCIAIGSSGSIGAPDITVACRDDAP